jgi:tetratricopeptide (TPR) repeat protein
MKPFLKCLQDRRSAAAGWRLAGLTLLILFGRPAGSFAAETNAPPPVSARDFFNAGTRLLAVKKYPDAEKMFQASLQWQDERLQARALFNLGHTRFAEGAELLTKGPDAQTTQARGRTALAAAAAVIHTGEAALADAQVDRMVMAYLQGRGARRDLRTAEKAVRSALEVFGKTLNKWKRAADDFHSAAELNPADLNAQHNAEAVERRIAELVDTLRQMMEMLGEMEGKKQDLGKMMSKLKGQIPAPDAPPGENGEDGDDEPQGVKPESLAGQEENAGREGEPAPAPLSPEVAGQILDGLSVDGSRRLPMGGDKPGTPPKEKSGRNW